MIQRLRVKQPRLIKPKTIFNDNREIIPIKKEWFKLQVSHIKPRLRYNSAYLIYRKTKEEVGHIEAIRYGKIDSREYTVYWLQSFNIKDKIRNQGLGSMLLKSLLDKLSQIGGEYAELQSEPEAVSLYKRFGFEIVKKRMCPTMSLDLKKYINKTQ